MEKEHESHSISPSTEQENSYLKRALIREKKAKKEAEKIIEVKSSELYEVNRELEQLNVSLEKKVEDRTRQLVWALEKAEESINAKERFLANISHEIRTPMNAIIGFTDILIKDEKDDAKSEYLSAIKTSSDNLLVLINDILDFSKIGAGKLTLDYDQINFHELIKEVIYFFNQKAKENGISLSFTIDPGIQEKLVADAVRLRQILTNLLANAIKFTRKGSVSLSCGLKEDMDDHQLIEMCVKDTGVGIEEKNLDKIFESFSQEDQRITKEFGGTGLGLAICKELVKLMKGEIAVESEKGSGTTFSVCIPMKKIEREGINENTIPTTDQKVAFDNKIKILLADDNEFNQLLVKAIFTGENVLLDVATNGEQAIEKVKDSSYDVILMDVHMPVMDGMEATRIIRKELKINTPIIALTANARKEDKVQYMSCGMTDYLSKPFDQDILRMKIKDLVDKNTHMKSETTYDLERLKTICGKDEATYYHILGRIVDSNDRLIKDAVSQMKVGNCKEVRLAVHTMKNSIAMIDAQPMLKIIEEIEMLEGEDQKEMDMLVELLYNNGISLSEQLKLEIA